MRPHRAYMYSRPEKANYKPGRVDFLSWFELKRADFRPKQTDFGSGRTNFGPERGDFRSERVDLEGERTDGRKDVQKDERKFTRVLQDIGPWGPLPKRGRISSYPSGEQMGKGE